MPVTLFRDGSVAMYLARDDRDFVIANIGSGGNGFASEAAALQNDTIREWARPAFAQNAAVRANAYQQFSALNVPYLDWRWDLILPVTAIPVARWSNGTILNLGILGIASVYVALA